MSSTDGEGPDRKLSWRVTTARSGCVGFIPVDMLSAAAKVKVQTVANSMYDCPAPWGTVTTVRLPAPLSCD